MKRISWFILPIVAVFTMTMSVNAQKYGSTPEDSLACIQNLSIYQEFYKQENYIGAYPAWKRVLDICPRTSLNTYIRGNVILKNMIAQTTDVVKKQEFVDELLTLWDLRIHHYGRYAYCKGMKAKDLKQYRPNEIDAILSLYDTAFSNLPIEDKALYTIPFFYFEGIIHAYRNEKISKEELIEAYNFAAEKMNEYAVAHPTDANIPNTINTLDLMFEPFATCPDLITLFTNKFGENKTNKVFLEKAAQLLDKRKCSDSDIFFMITDALHSIEPTAKSALLMSRMYYVKKDFEKAIDYVKEYAGTYERNDININVYLLLADCYLQTAQYTLGRDVCNEALKLDANSGKAYLLLGTLYASGAQLCGEDEIGKRAAYWVAVDMFIKAKNIDPSIEEAANKYIVAYKLHFPSGDDLFTFGFNEGDNYTVKCWFTATTKIRAR